MENRSLTAYQFSLDSAIAEWVAQKKIRTGSEKTEKAYDDTMQAFRAFLSLGGFDLLMDLSDDTTLAGYLLIVQQWAGRRAPTMRQSR